MLIGVPKETKAHEYRVGLVPTSVRELVANHHQVIIETQAGIGIGMSDADYLAAGATIAETASEIFSHAELIIKVKEPLPDEYGQLQEGQTLFTYLHLAADEAQMRGLQQSNSIAIAYETVTAQQGGLPLLSPMSEVAGRMSIQAAAHCLEKRQGGRGVLLSGVPGVAAAQVMVLGGGVVGTNAIRMAIGLGARVNVIDNNLARLKALDLQFGNTLNTVYSTKQAIEEYVTQADVVIGAVLIPGAAAPKLVSEAMVKTMKAGAVMVDVAIDQGGCIATSRPTNHTQPTYVTHDVVHYCVTNMPGAVPRTATLALNNATLPYILELANKGVKQALLDNQHLRNGANVYCGKITQPAVADLFAETYHPILELL